MKKLKSLAALISALAMTLSLTACGGSGTGENKAAEPTATPEYVYSATYSNLIEEDDSYLSPRLFSDGGYYASSYEKVGSNIPEGVTPEYEGQYDIYKTFLYYISGDGKVTKLEGYTPLDSEENTENYREFSSGTDLSGIGIAPDGSIVTVEYIYSSWFDGPEGMDRNSDDYYNYYRSSQKYFVRWLEADGTEKSRSEIAVNPDEYIDAYNMKMDDKGNVLLSTGTGLRAIAADGTESYYIESNSSIDNIIVLPDKSLVALVWSENDQGMAFMPIDTENGTFGESIPAPSSAYSAVTGDSNYDIYYTNGVNFYGYNLDSSEPVKLFNWLSCDVNSQDLGTVYVSGDGQFTCFTINWNQDSQTYSVDKIVVDKVPYDSVPHKETITMATLSLDYYELDQIVKFNRSNDKYRIEVTDYSEYNNDSIMMNARAAQAIAADGISGGDSNPGLTKLNTELMAGNVPDIICLTGLNYTQLASKGLLEDLYPFIDADSELSRDDLYDNVLSAMEVDGKLYTTVSNYYINTVIGASSVVGDKPGWNYEEFATALAGMPEGCTAFEPYVTRGDMLQNCLALDMSNYVNWTTGECNFDSQEFIDLLKFANQFPEEYDWENNQNELYEDGSTRLSQGKQMLATASLYSIQDVLYNSGSYLQSLGGAITYIGYPTSEGTGNMIGITNGSYAMSSSSKVKDAVWQYLRTFFTDEYQKEVGWSLPSNKAVFEELAEDAMTVKYQKDSDGNFLLDEDGERIPIAIYSTWDEATQTSNDIYSMTEEQVDQIRSLISTTTKVADYNSDIFDIVNTEVSAYFAGQKSAEDVAKLIQSKANIFVNEQR